MTSTAPAPVQLDFESLLSRDYRPARLTKLVAREAYKPPEHTRGGLGGSGTDRRKKKKKEHEDGEAAADAAVAEAEAEQEKVKVTQATSRLVWNLVTHTPAFTRHLPAGASSAREEEAAALLTTTKQQQQWLHKKSIQTQMNRDIASIFHPVQLADWESKIDWEGVKEDHPSVATTSATGSTATTTTAATTTGSNKEETNTNGNNNNNNNSNNNKNNNNEKGPSSSLYTSNDALALLKRPRNPFLDHLVFDETTISWTGDTDELLRKAKSAPLILELGVAGQSVARHVYQNTVLSAQRPLPALKSDAYQDRMERDWSSQPIQSTADVGKGTLHADKDKMEALIAARQQKRAQMAKDKTNRVTQAMGTLALGGGRGRTITSSLMGPGGTERTGRPSRHVGSSASHDTEYIEQLDMVNNHSMVRDLSKVLLRQFHRPKLPLSVLRPDFTWQFQVRYTPASKKGGGGPGDATGGVTSSSYQSIMMGAHAGAISKAKLRTEADLTPAEGKLVLLEYSEERPPIQLAKGMATKIVNYYRGDKARCPVSAGGGDRPARRKRGGENTKSAKQELSKDGRGDRPPRLDGPNRETTVTDWVGKIPKKSKSDRIEKETIDILPEGISEMLHPKVHGPFIGEVEEGTTVTGLISNLFVAPMFRHDPESTDFLMILTPPGGAARPGQRDSMNVILRDLPSSVYTVGQTEPRTRVYAPNTQGEKNFVGPFVSYQIARVLTRSQAREGQGLRFDELQDRVLPNLELPANALRQRLKQVAVYDKNTSIWTTKPMGYEEYPGVDALGKSIAPEGVVAFESASSASRRLTDLGMHTLYLGSHTVASVGVAMVYLAGYLNAARELHRKMKKLVDLSKSNKSIQPIQICFYEKSAAELESLVKKVRLKHEVATFIYEELQLTPWHLTGEFIDVHKKGEGTGMMKLTGLGDPTGTGEGFSFLREVDSKPSKSVGNAALNAQVKKITGTEDDLRKLTMKQMAALLRSYGMPQKEIDTLKRWDRVHVIRDLSTKAASDGIGDGLERFARGEKLKLSEQKEMYRERIQVIWRRQIASLSMDSGDKAIGMAGADGNVGAPGADGDGDAVPAAQAKKAAEKEKEDSDSDSEEDDDDLAAALEEEMMDRTEANQLVAEHTGGGGGSGLGHLRAATQDQDMTKDARELAALKRQREEERAAQEGLSMRPKGAEIKAAAHTGVNRKVIRKKVTKTHPDGRQTTTFKFILHPEEVGKIMAKLAQAPEDKSKQNDWKYDTTDDKPPGHAMFEDEDDFEYSSKGRFQANARRRVIKKRAGGGAAAAPPQQQMSSSGRVTPKNLQIGKLKTKVSKEERMKKRKREEEEREVYTTTAKRKGTNNRRERGSIRDRRPHVIFAEKLESIRAAVESRPMAGPFVKPVNRRLIPRYYEVISHPIDLATIREKISKYEYRTAEQLIRDFELMKTNAIKFNGETNPISQEAVGICDFVKDQITSKRSELSSLEEAVKEQMSTKPKKKKKGGAKKKSASAPTGNVTSVGGVSVNLGDLSSSLHFEDDGSESDDSIADLDL